MEEAAGCIGCLTVFLLIVLAGALFAAGLPLLGLVIGVLLWSKARGFAVAFLIASLIAFGPLASYQDIGPRVIGDGQAVLSVIGLLGTSVWFLARTGSQNPSFLAERVLVVCLLVGYGFVWFMFVGLFLLLQ